MSAAAAIAILRLNGQPVFFFFLRLTGFFGVAFFGDCPEALLIHELSFTGGTPQIYEKDMAANEQ